MKNSKFQLFPEFDNTQIYITGKVNINNELVDTEKKVTFIEKKLLASLNDEDVSSITSVIGFKLDAKNKAEMGEHLFHIFIDLHERAPSNIFDTYISPYLSLEYNKNILSRKRDAKIIAKDIEKILDKFRDVKEDNMPMYEELIVKVPGAGIVAHDIEISLSAKDENSILDAIKYLSDKFSKIDGVYNIANDADIGEKELKLRVNQYGQRLGFNEELISRELRSYYLKGEYGKMFNNTGLIRIKIESDINKKIDSINSLELEIPNTKQFVKLIDICDFEFIQGFVELNKEEGVRIRSIFASLDKKIITSTEVIQKIKPSLEKLKNDGFNIEIKGEEKENAKNKKEMLQSAIIAIFLIFITLVWLFDSIKKSLIVISTIPLVLFGVYFGHLVMGLNMTMTGLIGTIGLAGVVVNDGLIMVDFIKHSTNTEDLIQRAKTRLRPILLTSLTTVLGLSTLIFFASGQAKILQPMAISLGFGIAWATILNLVYVPLLYAVVFKINKKR
jgi:multidrug efflux pump subunit AcrB